MAVRAKLFSALASLLLATCSAATTFAATYTWNVGTGLWATPASWSPARTTPSATDILVFDGAVTPSCIVSDIPVTDTFAQLRVTGGIFLTILVVGDDTLKVAGGTGDDLVIDAGATLALNATPSAHSTTIVLQSGATGRIAGGLSAANGAHRVLPTDPGSLVFAFGSNCYANAGFQGYLFGNSGTPDVVIFQSGSTYHGSAGFVAFGLTAPDSRIVLQPGSRYRHLALAAGGALNGRTYGDCSIEVGAGNSYVGPLTLGCTIHDLNIVSGKIRPLAGTPTDSALVILGNLYVAIDGELEFDPPGPDVAKIRFRKNNLQAIYGEGAITLGPYSQLEVAQTNGVILQRDLFSNGVVKLSAGLLITGEHLLHLGHTGTVVGPKWVSGNLGMILPSSAANVTRTFHVGNFFEAPVTLSFASVGDTGTVVVRTEPEDHIDLDASGLDVDRSVNRYWTITNLGATFTTCDATFSFHPAEVDNGSDPNSFRVGKLDSGTWTLPAIGTRTATSTQVLAITSFSDFVVAEVDGSTGVEGGGSAIASLSPARPSPFAASTTLEFTLSSRGAIDLSIYDITGRQVRSLARGVRAAGTFRAQWDGRDDGGGNAPAGTYFARLTTPEGNFRRTVVRLR